MTIPIAEYAARAPAHVCRIFDAADRNQDGLLDKNEMVGLLIALNPALRIDWVTAHHLVDLVIQRYKFHVKDKCLTREGLQLSYDEGAGDAERDLLALGLVPEQVSPEEALQVNATLEAGIMPEPAPDSDRTTPGTEELTQCAAVLANMVMVNPGTTNALEEPGPSQNIADGAKEEDIPGLVALIRGGAEDTYGAGVQPEEIIAAALGMLCNLTFDSVENRIAFRTAGGLECLPLHLFFEEPDEPIRRAIGIKAAVLVTNLTIFCPENQDGMNRAGVIQALVAMLSKIQAFGHAGGALAEKVVVAIWSLAYDHLANKEHLEACGAITVLISVLDPSESSVAVGQKAGLALWCLVRDVRKNQDAVRDAGGITALCLILRRFCIEADHRAAAALPEDSQHGSSTTVPRSMAIIALSAIQTLTNRNLENSMAVRSVGGLPAIVQLLKMGSQEELTWMAAATLWTMAYDSSDTKDAIREAGGVNLLVHLLEGYPYVYCLQNAVGALRMLAIENEINKDAIRLAGGVRALVRVLEGSCDHRDVMVQCLAAAGLAALAYDNVHNQKAIIQDGGDAVLLSVLSVARDARLVDHLASALFELTNNNPEAALAVAEKRKTFPQVVRLFTRDLPPQTREKTAGLLCNLANAGNQHQNAIRHAGGIYALHSILTSEDPQQAVMMNSVAALCNLAYDNEENRDAIRDAGCIPALVRFLEEAESLEAKDKAVGAICNLAYMSPENKDDIGAAGAIPLLLRLLETARALEGPMHAKLSERTVGALCTLAYHNPMNQAEIKAAGGIKLLNKVKRAKAEKISSDRAKVALANIADSSALGRRHSDFSNVSTISQTRNGSLTPRTLGMIFSSPGSRPSFAKHSGRSGKSPSTTDSGSSSRHRMHWLSPRHDRPESEASPRETMTPDRVPRLRFHQRTESYDNEIFDTMSLESPSPRVEAAEPEGVAQPTTVTTPRRSGAGKLRMKFVQAFSGMLLQKHTRSNASSPALKEVAEQLQMSPRSAAKTHFGISR